MKDSRKGGSMAMARQYTDHDLRVLLYVKELRKRSWNQREITSELTQRLAGKDAPALPALIDSQSAAIPTQPEAPQVPTQAPQQADQAIIAEMFPPYGNRTQSAPVDQPAPAQAIKVDPPITPIDQPEQVKPTVIDPPAIPALPVIVPFAGEVITYTKTPTQPAALDGIPDDPTLIKRLQDERGDLFRIAWALNIDHQELWKYVTRSATLRSVYLQARWGHGGGGVTVADLRAAKFG